MALLLIGVGCTDLAHSVRHTRFLPGTCGAVATVVVGLLAGLTGWPDLAAVLVVAAFAFTWELAVSRGFSAARPALPLALLVAAIGAAALLSGQAGAAGGPLGRWVDPGRRCPWWATWTPTASCC